MPPSLARVLRRVRRRLRLQALLDGVTVGLLCGAGLGALVLYLHGLGLFGRGGLALGGAAAGLIVLGAALWRLTRPLPAAQVAKRIDDTHGLHDRLGSALAFLAEPEPTPFMQAAIDDALAAAGRVDPRRAARLHRPRGIGYAAFVCALCLLLSQLRFPAKALPKPRFDAPPAKTLTLPADLLEQEREAVAELLDEAAESEDAELKELADQLKQLLDKLDEGELSRKEVFDKLAQIEKRLDGAAGDVEDFKKAMKQAGVELGKSKLGKDAGKALEKGDLEKAKKELEKLAAAAQARADEMKTLEKDKPDKKDDPKDAAWRELSRALQRSAERMQNEEERRMQERERKLKEEQRRLNKELEQNPQNQEARRKLERNQRELERLERERQQKAEQRRQLERLERELQKAAEQLRQKMSPEAAEALRKLAEQMGQMQNQIQKLGNGQTAKIRIAELKEVLRRAGQSGQGQNGQGQNGQKQGQNGQEQGQNGQQGQNGEKGQNGQQGKGQGDKDVLVIDFNQRAGQKSDTLLILPGMGQPKPGGGGNEKGDQPGQKGQDPGGQEHGDGHDPNLTGKETSLAAKHKDSQVQGQHGAGPDRSETILGSAQKGFASKSYKKVYSDYHTLVEEVMTQERIPPGYRYYIKRYFNLIRPRE
jgi:septal ring factor EnvC (AmiA/AmiB activator)